MVSTKDILMELLFGLSWMATGIFFMVTGYPVLIIPAFFLFIFIKVKRKGNKKILPYVKTDFEQLGYELISERPTKFSETKLTFSFEPTLNGVPLSRYRYLRRFTRIFKARNKHAKLVEINAVVTKKWNGENAIEIVGVKNVAC